MENKAAYVACKLARAFGLSSLALIIGCSANEHAARVDAPDTPLNSESIKARFGSYHIRVLAQQGDYRVSDLYSLDASGCAQTRTLAYVEYDKTGVLRAGPAHADILAGHSIGSTLQAAGYRVVKSQPRIGLWTPPAQSLLASQFESPDQAFAIYQYDLIIAADSHETRYARLLEIYDPDYRRFVELRRSLPNAKPLKFTDNQRRRIEAALQEDQVTPLSCG